MTEPPPTALQAANARRHHQAHCAVRQAITDLQRSGSVITFTAVSKTSGVARSWLYDQPDIRQLIGQLRRSAPPPVVDNERASAESLRRMAEGLRLELGRLRQENKALREHLARQLGHDRTHATTLRPSPSEDISSPSSPSLTSTSS
jgi:hypothetical protein